MKKYFMTRLLASLTAIFSITLLFAQDQKPEASTRFNPAQINTIAALISEPVTAHKSAAVYVKARVMRSFLELFTDATEVKWSISNYRYFASFTQNNRRCKALFDSNGGLVYSLKYGTEKDLPRPARKLLKSEYLDYTIDVVTELNSGDINTWIINLSDHDNLVVARVYDGSIEELHHYKNAVVK